MVLEEQIQRYCLNHINKKLFIPLFISLFLFLFIIIFYLLFSEVNKNEKIIKINKGSNLKEISSLILNEDYIFQKNFYYIYLKFYNLFINNIDYGEFRLPKNSNLINITEIISNSSNVFYKFIVVDGWQEFQLNNYLENLNFYNEIQLKYQNILADTYKYNSEDSFKVIFNLMKKNKTLFFDKHYNNALMKKYSINEIMTIASLVEKEGKNENDKRFISSVIINRLNSNMKLQIDASTIFAITKGKFKFERKLNYQDLKINDKFNTYFIKGLPPSPICFVGRKTIEIVLENYKSEYLFYFYDNNLKRHIFSKSFNDHKNKLTKYRQKN